MSKMRWIHFVAIFLVSFFTSTKAFSFDFQRIVDSALTYINDAKAGDDVHVRVDVDSILERFRRSVEEISQQKLTSVTHAYGIESVESRAKRDIPDTLTDIQTATYSVTNLDTTLISVGDASDAFDISLFELNGELYGVVGLDQAGQKTTEFLHLNESTYTLLQSISTPNATGYEILTLQGNIYTVVLRDSSAKNDGIPAYTSVLKFDPNGASANTEIQRLYTPGGSSIEEFYHTVLGKSCIAIANAYKRGADDMSLKTKSSVYCWEGAYFDEFVDFETIGAHDLKPFYIHNRLYLAVANHMDDDGNTGIDSVILMYDQHERLFLPHQYIRTEGAVDWEAFTLGSGYKQEHFLAVANGPSWLDLERPQADGSKTVESVIYKYSHGQFVPFQCFPTTGAKKWQAHSGDNGEFVLALLNAGGITLYEYDGWRFVAARPTPRNDILSGATMINSAIVYDSFCNIVLNPNIADSHSFFEFNFTASYLVQSIRQNVTEQCDAAADRLATATTQFNDLTAAADNLVYINSNQTQVITGHKTFTDDMTVEQTSTIHKIEGNLGGVFDNSEVYTLNEVKDNITRLQQKILELDGILDNSMKVNEDQRVSGAKSFQTVLVNNLHVDSTFTVVDAETVNSFINLTDLSTNVFTTNQNHDIYVDLEFEDNLIIQGNLVVNGLLDGHDLDDVVTLDADQTLTAKQFFKGPVSFTGPLDVQGTVDGVQLTPSSVLLTNDDGATQTMSGKLSFVGEVNFNQINVDGSVDGVDLSTFKDNAVYVDGNHNITGVKTFSSEVVVDGSLNILNNHLLDGVQVDVLNGEVLKKSGTQQITGSPTFNSLHASADITVDGTVDGLNIPEDHLLVSQNATITGNLTFTQDVTVSKLQGSGTIDGINTNHAGSFDVMTLSGNQNVAAAKAFMGDIMVDDALSFQPNMEIDGVDVSAMAADSVDLISPQTIDGSKIFSGNITVQGTLDSAGDLNGVDTSQMAGNVVKLSEGIVQTQAGIVFSADTTFNAHLITNNQHKIHGAVLSDFATQGSSETIDGFKTFASDVNSTANVAVTGTVGGHDLSDMESNAWLLADSGAAVTVSGTMDFTGGVSLQQNLNLTGSIDGILLSDAVTVSGAQSISSVTTFSSDLHVDVLTVNGDISIDGKLNGLNVVNIDADTLKVSGTQIVTGRKIFVDEIEVNGDMTVDGTVNGVDLFELKSDAVMVDGVQTVSGNKTFAAVTRVAALNVTGDIDGVDVETFVTRVVTQDTAQNISGFPVFDNDVQADSNVTVVGLINGVDLDALKDEALKVTDTTFGVAMTFGEVISGGNVLVTGTVDGVNIATDTISTNQVDASLDASLKTFQNDVSIQTLTVEGTVDGVDITTLDSSALLTSGDQNITVPKTFQGTVEFQNNVQVGGTTLVEEIDIEDFAANAMRVTDGISQTVSGSFFFSGNVTVLQPATVTGLIDGVNITLLNNTYMSLSQDQEVTGTKVFYADVIARKNFTASQVDVSGFFNGVNFSQWATEVLFENKDQTVNSVLVFTENTTVRGNVGVDGLTDGIDLSTNLMQLNADNVITGQKNLSGMVISGNLNMNSTSTINNIDVSAWRASIVHVSDDAVISGNKTFSNMFIQGNLSVTGDVDGIEVSSDNLLTLSREQIISGVKNFSDHVYFDGNIEVAGLLNGINIEDLKTNTLYTVDNQTMTGDITFTQAVTFQDLYIKGLIDNLDIDNLFHDIYNHSDMVEFNKTVEDKCQLMDDMHEAAEDVAIFFSNLEEDMVISNAGEVQWGSYIMNGVQQLLMINKRLEGCQDATRYAWNLTTNAFEDAGRAFGTDGGVEIETFAFGGYQFLIIVHSQTSTGNNSPCGDDMDTTYKRAPANTAEGTDEVAGKIEVAVWNSTSQAFVAYQDLLSYSAKDAEPFLHPNTNKFCIAVANYAKGYGGQQTMFISRRNSFVYCLVDFETGFQIESEFETRGATQIKHFEMSGTSYLAVANYQLYDTTDLSYTTDSEVFQWNSGDYTSFETIVTTRATDILPLNINGMQYLIISQESVASGDTVNIYSFNGDTNSFDWLNGISINSPRSVEHMKIQSNDYLFILDADVGFYVYKYSGIALFTLDKFINVESAQTLHIFEHTMTGDFYLALGTVKMFSFSPYVLPTMLNSDNSVFKGEITGSYTPSIGCTN